MIILQEILEFQELLKIYRIMFTYSDFLDQFDIIDEDTFNEIVESLPDKGEMLEQGTNLYMTDLSDIDEVCVQFLSPYLNDFEDVYIDQVNYVSKKIWLYDVASLEDLEAIKKLFSNWNIENYDELVETIKEQEADKTEADILCDKIRLIRPLLNKISLEDVKNIIKTYEQK